MTPTRPPRIGEVRPIPSPRAVRDDFLSSLRFPLDAFQLEAIDVLDRGHSVLVTAPTGSGKTLIASYGVRQAFKRGAKSFYTTPLKALSNQKHAELIAEYGMGNVGLLTGDVAVRPDAPIVVMTTEVLRNMLLADSSLLEGLGVVVLDEVHFLQDPYRGGVWEEVLVLSPREITFICLSATVANATDVGAWIASVRGPTEVVIERHRPITLRHHFAIERRGERTPELIPLLVDDRPGEEGLRLDQQVRKALEGRQPTWRGGHDRGPLLPVKAPRRSDLIDLLDAEELLPAIVFIFSRAACDDAVRQCLRAGVRLTSRHERAEIRRIVEAHVESLTDEDLAVLGYTEWLEGLEAGIASHHAGLVPAFREAVEACFVEGLLGVVFATETLSLGINMPARTAVIERFSKYGGAGRTPLTSGEYSQLTGRAGRRGLDMEGHAVVVWNPETTFAEAARVATAPPPDLHSSFRPTYNLACNLVRRYDRERAILILERSYAQWEANRRPEQTRRTSPAIHLDRRLAVLESLHYIDGWSLTPLGGRLARIYHESDLIICEALEHGVLDGADPAVLAGVLSSLVFERRRAKRIGGPARADKGRRSEPGARPRRKGKGIAGDRLGGTRREEIDDRTAELVLIGERIRTLEEFHHVGRTKAPEPMIATAMASWVRGASFATVMDVMAAEVGDVAPGDFVRSVKQLADLTGQIALLATDEDLRASATAAVDRLMRNVVIAGGLSASASSEVTAS